MPWQKGQSGNPNGRPKGLERRVREIVGDDFEMLVRAQIQIAKGQAPDCAPKLEIKASDSTRAFVALLDRGWGKPKEQHEITGGMTPEQMAIFEALKLTPYERRLAAQDTTTPDDVIADDAAMSELVDGDDA